MSTRILRRFQVGGLPLIERVLRRLGLREILSQFLPPSDRQQVGAVDVLILLIVNLILAKDPLYELAQWVESLDLRALGYRQRPAVRFTDDRFARALDQLYAADRASLLTRLVVAAIHAFALHTTRIHNDSTTLKACGRIPGRTRSGLELRHGHSKDHRPDLRQLVYTLSLSDDGAVPIHHHVYPGNRNDETTHIETWDALCRIHGGPNFLYVGDCKLCTDRQLAHIVAGGGHAITILPQNFKEVRGFKDQLRADPSPGIHSGDAPSPALPPSPRRSISSQAPTPPTPRGIPCTGLPPVRNASAITKAVRSASRWRKPLWPASLPNSMRAASSTKPRFCRPPLASSNITQSKGCWPYAWRRIASTSVTVRGAVRASGSITAMSTTRRTACIGPGMRE